MSLYPSEDEERSFIEAYLSRRSRLTLIHNHLVKLTSRGNQGQRERGGGDEGDSPSLPVFFILFLVCVGGDADFFKSRLGYQGICKQSLGFIQGIEEKVLWNGLSIHHTLLNFQSSLVF